MSDILPLEIDIENSTFSYEDGNQALTDITLKARLGEFIVILGANGAGKSTLCYLLSGIAPHIYGGKRTGKVIVAGHDPWDEPIYETARYCGVLLQDPEVQLFNPNVFHEMAFGPANLNVTRAEIIQRIADAMSLLHLDGLEKRNPRDLSGGQKQRVALGAVLTMQPRVLVLDEPTSQLDPVGRSEVVEAIHRLKSAGRMTIIMTTHETDDILDLADQVLVLDKGRIVLSGTPAEVFTKSAEIAAAGVKMPDALDIKLKIDRLCGTVQAPSDEQINKLDVERVGQIVAAHILAGRLEILEQPAPQATDKIQHPPIVLEALNLSYQYPGFPPVPALKQVNLTVRAGEMVGIVGQNGSGKSTLVKCFVGLLRPSQGEARVLGKNIAKVPVGQMARQVGLVLQNPDYQLFTASSKEEILFGLRNLEVPEAEAESRMLKALQWVELENELETFPFRMSFGDRRKLAVAATVALDPQVLILDEPTTAQDHRGRYQLAEIGQRFRSEAGRTVLMITHDMDLIARYAERLVVMWNGQIIMDGPTAQVFVQQEELARTFLRPPVAAQVAKRLLPFGIPADIVTQEELVGVLRKKVF